MMNVMKKTHRTDGWWYPWIFIAAFGVIIAVNGTMAYFALATWTGLETEDAFQKGQEFNAQLNQQARQDALGWTVDADFTPAGVTGREGRVRVTFTDDAGRGVGQLSLTGEALRPTHEGYDQTLAFAPQGGGLYEAPVTFPLPGLWELRVTAQRADEMFKLRQRIRVD